MIAATAASNQLPLHTANPDGFKGAQAFVEVVGVRSWTKQPLASGGRLGLVLGV